MNKLIVLIAALCVIAVGWGFYVEFPGTPSDPAPRVTEGELRLAFGEEGAIGDLSLKPLELLEDSRCPIDVQCIQAGIVRVSVNLSSALGSAPHTFRLGEPITTEAETVVLTLVEPVPKSTITIEPASYRFTFEVTRR